jgi:hypothetical protein
MYYRLIDFIEIQSRPFGFHEFQNADPYCTYRVDPELVESIAGQRILTTLKTIQKYMRLKSL